MSLDNLIVKQLMIGPMMNYGYLIGDKAKGVAAIVDPGWEGKRLIKEASTEGLKIESILATHTHYDHVNDVPYIAGETGCKIYVHNAEAKAFGDLPNVVSLNDGDKISVGEFEIEFIHTPGHSPGSICFRVNDILFTGDALFVDAIGRTDLQGGSSEEMFHSLAKLKQLPDKVVVYPGHNYGPAMSATIGEQKRTNPYMRCSSISDFLRIA